MKLAVFIPAYNEQDTIGQVISAIPRLFRGIKEYRIFVVDDGSTDLTAHAARTHGAQVVELAHVGLAGAFRAGLEASLDWGADIIAHLDADGQYDPAEIALIIEPILQGKADMVTGDRQVSKLRFMGPARKYGNMIGSWLLRVLTGLKVRDASSGMRAYNRAAAEKLEVHSKHTYTHETLIEAHFKGLWLVETPITFLPRGGNTTGRLFGASVSSDVQKPTSDVETPPPSATSRLTRNLFKHVFRSLQGILAAMGRYGKIERKNGK